MFIIQKILEIVEAKVYSNKSTEHSKCKEFIIDGERTSKASAISDGFNNFFSSVAMSILRKTNPLANFIWRKPKSLIFRTKKVFSFRQVSKVEIVNELRKLKRNKATGNDDLPSNLLKDVSSCIANPLVYIFNLSLPTSIIPQAWKVARITPLYKSGLSTNIDNCRVKFFMHELCILIQVFCFCSTNFTWCNSIIKYKNLSTNKYVGLTRHFLCTYITKLFIVKKWLPSYNHPAQIIYISLKLTFIFKRLPRNVLAIVFYFVFICQFL